MFRTEKESIDFFKKFMEKAGFTDIKFVTGYKLFNCFNRC